MWARFEDSQPEDGSKFAVMYHDGSGANAYFRSGGSYLRCEDGMEETIDSFDGHDLWSELPEWFGLFFMEQNDDF